MTDLPLTHEIHGHRVLDCPPEGPSIRYAEAVDLIGEAMGAGADWVVIPSARLGDDFFRLRTGVAGEVVQKFVTYGRRLAIVGDISAHVAASEPLRDFVRESNRGAHVWFVADPDEFAQRLLASPPGA